MKVKVLDEVLTVFLDRRLDSNNAESMNEKFDEILKDYAHQKLVFDAGDLAYISSAGIRVILMVAKSEKNFEIINASKEAYEIFEMTGLTSMLKIKKRIRHISLQGLEKIGSGFFSEVYRKNKDTIVKVYTKATSIDDVRRELDLAKKAFVLGIPTAISYDIVDADGMLGVEFEMLNSDSLRDSINKYPDKLDELMQKYANLLLTINSTEVKDCNLPNANDIAIEKLNKIKEELTTTEYEKSCNLISELKNSNMFIHGDCQIKNVMINDGEFLLIDMDTLCAGHPIFELASLHEAYVAFPEIQKGREGEFLGISNELPNIIFDKVMQYYFSDLNEEERNKVVERISLISYLDMMCWLRKNEEYTKEDFEYMVMRFKAVLNSVETLEF